MQFRVHKKISLIHISFHKCLVLLGIATTDDQIILTCDEPNELLEPEDLSGHCLHHLLLLEFCQISRCCCLCLLNSHVCCSFSLYLFLMGLLFDLEVLLNVKLSWDAEVDLNSHHWVKVLHELVVDLDCARVILILVNGIQHQTDLILLQVHFVNQVCELVAWLSLLFDHALNIDPANTRADHHWKDVDDGLGLECVL